MQDKLTWRREKEKKRTSVWRLTWTTRAPFCALSVAEVNLGQISRVRGSCLPPSRGSLPNPWLFNQDYEFTLFQIRGCFYCLVYSDFGFRPLFVLFGYVITTVCAFLPLQDSPKSFLLRLQYFVTPQNCVSYACHMRFFILRAHWKRWIIFCITQFCQLFIFLISLVHQILPLFCNSIWIIY